MNTSKNIFDTLQDFYEKHPTQTVIFFIIFGLVLLLPLIGVKWALAIGGILSIGGGIVAITSKKIDF